MKRDAGRVLLYVVMGVAVVVALLIAIAWVTRTPLYTLQTAERPECVTPAPDRDVLIGLAVSGGGSRAALFVASAFWRVFAYGLCLLFSNAASSLSNCFTTLLYLCLSALDTNATSNGRNPASKAVGVSCSACTVS